MEYLNSKYAEDCVDEPLSLASTLDPGFKNRYNNNDRIKATGTALTEELVAMLTEEDSPTPGPSTSSAHAMTSEPVAGDDDTSEPAKKRKKSFGSYFKKP